MGAKGRLPPQIFSEFEAKPVLSKERLIGGHNLFPPGWNRVKVAAKSLWGPVLMSPCPQAHLNTVLLINNNRRYFLPS